MMEIFLSFKKTVSLIKHALCINHVCTDMSCHLQTAVYGREFVIFEFYYLLILEGTESEGHSGWDYSQVSDEM